MKTERDIFNQVYNHSMGNQQGPYNPMEYPHSNQRSFDYTSPDKTHKEQDHGGKNEGSKEEPDLEALASLGDEAGMYHDEHGINPARILRYREDKEGNIIFLCHEETPDGKRFFYILRASKKTGDWKKVVSDYRKD